MERIYNIFLFVENDLIAKIGVVEHETEGSDDEKYRFLAEKVNQDFCRSRIFPIPKNFIAIEENTGKKVQGYLTWKHFLQLVETGQSTQLYHEVFDAVSAPQECFYLMTPIVDGVPTFRKIVTGVVEDTTDQKSVTFYNENDWFTNILATGNSKSSG